MQPRCCLLPSQGSWLLLLLPDLVSWYHIFTVSQFSYFTVYHRLFLSCCSNACLCPFIVTAYSLNLPPHIRNWIIGMHLVTSWRDSCSLCTELLAVLLGKFEFLVVGCISVCTIFTFHISHFTFHSITVTWCTRVCPSFFLYPFPFSLIFLPVSSIGRVLAGKGLGSIIGWWWNLKWSFVCYKYMYSNILTNLD